MPRAKGGFKTRRRRKKIIKQASGYRGAKSRLTRTASQEIRRGMRYATIGRKLRKRDFRSLWIVRLGSALKEYGISYSRFIGKLVKANIQLNRKMLSELAVHNPKSISKIIEEIK